LFIYSLSEVCVLFNKNNNLNNNDLDGLVWITNRQVFVKNEKKGGMPPLINPCDEVKLLVNGLEFKHITAVSENDVIELKTSESEIDAEMNIEVKDDGLKAFFSYAPARIVKNFIEDSPPVNKLDVKVKQQTIEIKSIKAEQIKDFLKCSDIVYGIDDSIIEEICSKNTAGTYLISIGTAALEPTDDTIEYYFNTDDDTTFSS
jgi:uncharacterized protein (DUF342 family)